MFFGLVYSSHQDVLTSCIPFVLFIFNYTLNIYTNLEPPYDFEYVFDQAKWDICKISLSLILPFSLITVQCLENTHSLNRFFQSTAMSILTI